MDKDLTFHEIARAQGAEEREAHRAHMAKVQASGLMAEQAGRLDTALGRAAEALGEQVRADPQPRLPEATRVWIERNGHWQWIWGPALGLATTRQLLEEIKARGEREDYYTELGTEMAIGARSLLQTLPGSMLDYRTVDGS